MSSHMEDSCWNRPGPNVWAADPQWGSGSAGWPAGVPLFRSVECFPTKLHWCCCAAADPASSSCFYHPWSSSSAPSTQPSVFLLSWPKGSLFSLNGAFMFWFIHVLLFKKHHTVLLGALFACGLWQYRSFTLLCVANYFPGLYACPYLSVGVSEKQRCPKLLFCRCSDPKASRLPTVTIWHKNAHQEKTKMNTLDSVVDAAGYVSARRGRGHVYPNNIFSR